MAKTQKYSLVKFMARDFFYADYNPGPVLRLPYSKLIMYPATSQSQDIKYGSMLIRDHCIAVLLKQCLLKTKLNVNKLILFETNLKTSALFLVSIQVISYFNICLLSITFV